MAGLRTLTFTVFQTRLIELVRLRIRNGEYTERGLARLAGISQPHLHNLLKGIRDLTAASADSLLTALDAGVLDLATAAELGDALQMKVSGAASVRVAPVADGKAGPGWPLPDLRQPAGWRPLPAALGDCGRRPVVVSLAPDPVLSAVFPNATDAVIDTDPMVRVHPSPQDWYLIRHRGAGLLRRIRVLPERIEILGQLELTGESEPDVIPLDSVSVLHIVRGRVVWLGELGEEDARR